MLNLRFAVAGFALTMAALPAAAQKPIVVDGSVPTVAVSYADLDLSSTAGRQSLQSRVARAASSLCTESGRKSLIEATREHRCLTTALNKARQDIDSAIANTSVRMASKSTIVMAAK